MRAAADLRELAERFVAEINALKVEIRRAFGFRFALGADWGQTMLRRKAQSLLVVAGVAGTAWMALTSPAVGADLYRCHSKDAVSLQDDGTLGRNKATEFWQKQYDSIIVDTATGAIRFGDDNPKSWFVVQKGGPEHDFVAVPRSDLAVAATDFIRLRAWREMKTALFILYGLSMVVTGVCEPIK